MPAENSVDAALAALRQAVAGLENAVDMRFEAERESTEIDGEVRRVHADRARLAQELDQSESTVLIAALIDGIADNSDSAHEICSSVVQALQTIPSGQTRSYGELAGQLHSHPRAVARACASNAIGLLLPCHRVVASDGSLSGYRWGLQRKRRLLEQEQS